MLSNLYDKNCTKCSFCIGSANVCQGLGEANNPYSAKAKLLVVVDQPDIDVEKGMLTKQSVAVRNFTTVAHQVVGMTEEHYNITYLVKCRPMDGRKPDAEEDIECLDFLKAEVAALKPSVILTMGAVSARVVGGKMFGINASKDITDFEGVPVISTFHPNYLNHAPENLERFAKDIDRAYNIALDIKVNHNFSQLRIVKELREVEELCQYVKDSGIMCFDVETTGLDFTKDLVTVIGIAFQPGSAWVVPIHHFDSPFNPEECAQVYSMLSELFYDAKIQKVGHNVKFDSKFFVYRDIEFHGRLDDTMLMHHILDENSRHGLKDITGKIWPELVGYEDEVHKYKWEAVPLDVLSKYCGLDADLTLRLFHDFEAKLLKEPELYRLYRNLTAPAIKLLDRIEFEGMRVDTAFLDDSIERIQARIVDTERFLRDIPQVKRYEARKRKELILSMIEALTEKIATLYTKHGKETATIAKYKKQLEELKAGNIVKGYEEFNFNSTKQLGDLLYGVQGFCFPMPYDKKKRSHSPSTGEEYLMDLHDKTGFVDLLLEYRSLNKTCSTYFLGIKERTDAAGYIHPTFKIHGTTTGRLSCSNPNMQNIPRSGEYNALVKKIFKADPGCKIMQIDYSQAELRLVALASGDPVMLAAYANNEDLHTLTAKKVLNISDADWEALDPAKKKEYRTSAKAVNFGFIYGMGASKFMDYAKHTYGVVINEQQAQDWRNTYFDLYKELPYWHERMRRNVGIDGYVKTMFGRKRRLSDVWSSDDMKKGDAERQAINSPIQGTAGELTVFSMCLMTHRLPTGVRFLNTVHDSIILMVPENLVETVAKVAKNTCENALTKEYFNFSFAPIGMQVDIEVGDNWKELSEYKISV